MMSRLHAAMVGFDITPQIHPEYGAWGTTPKLTQIDMPLQSRCLALKQDDRLLIWFGSDLCGNPPAETDRFRDQVADAVSLKRQEVIWSTSQTHSSPTLPGSQMPGGSSLTERGNYDQAFSDAQRCKLFDSYIDAARQAIDQLKPAKVWVGRGFCDSMSYNTRLRMPTGGVKFSRHHLEGLQSGKFFDPTIALVRFDDDQGHPIGAVFNFCCHPATMIDDIYVSPDWVGTARQHIENQISGQPTMFLQGFCGDVNCHHLFGTPALAKRSGDRLGTAAADAMANLIPARAEPFAWTWQTIDINCRPMYSHHEIDHLIAQRRAFIQELDHDPQATWCDGINLTENFTAEQRKACTKRYIEYLEQARRICDENLPVRRSLELTVGAVRIGDVCAALSPGENFTMTGHRLRCRSPFVHTLVCGDTNGLFGYIGTDDEIGRGGYECDSFWKSMFFDGFRLAPAKGAAGRIIDASVAMLKDLNAVS